MLFSSALIVLIVIYAFACMIVGKRKAGQAVGSLIMGVGKGTIKIAARIPKIAIMFVINLTTMIIRMIGQPTEMANAWAVFIERMSDVIFG